MYPQVGRATNPSYVKGRLKALLRVFRRPLAFKQTLYQSE
ncbi:hypothetical protein HMPREF9120_02133 [Neisseria sp. oral taxon 020 str. F0370]|nr:hypothetical protein HMPREF9120_02133 [Neisseria sp. oral taxon 020 str. F0370]